MASRRRTFKMGIETEKYQPLEFELNDETFECKRAIQGYVLLEFVARADGDSGGDSANALYSFFEDCMSPGEYTRFLNYLKNPDVIISMENIGEIAGWLVEQYTERPTELPSDSSSGPSTSGPQSTVEPSSLGSHSAV